MSSWADEVRKDRRESSSWHYVNVPIDQEKYDRKFEDAKGGVVSKIGDFQRIVADRSAPRIERQEALKFLAHFVEDMHQPVHVGHRGDRGGNDLQVQFFGKGSNLHSVWDSGLIEHAHRPDAEYIQALNGRITPELAAQWSRGTVEDWANESLAAAKGAYTHPGAPGQLKSGVKLGDPYYEANLPTSPNSGSSRPASASPRSSTRSSPDAENPPAAGPTRRPGINKSSAHPQILDSALVGKTILFREDRRQRG